MATIIEEDVLTADTTPSAQTYFHEGPRPAEDLRPEERTDLTIKEAEELAQGEPFELIDGRMVFKMADSKHSRIQITLGAKLYNYFEQNPIGEVMPEFSLRLWPESKHRLPTPDIAVFLNENLRAIGKYATRAPDLTIEIASDDDRASAIFAKARLYLEKGGKAVWIVFPIEKRVMIMTPAEWRWESNTLACPELLPGFSVQVTELFSGLKRKSSPAKKAGAKAKTNGKSRSRRK